MLWNSVLADPTSGIWRQFTTEKRDETARAFEPIDQPHWAAAVCPPLLPRDSTLRCPVVSKRHVPYKRLTQQQVPIVVEGGQQCPDAQLKLQVSLHFNSTWKKGGMARAIRVLGCLLCRLLEATT